MNSEKTTKITEIRDYAHDHKLPHAGWLVVEYALSGKERLTQMKMWSGELTAAKIKHTYLVDGKVVLETGIILKDYSYWLGNKPVKDVILLGITSRENITTSIKLAQTIVKAPVIAVGVQNMTGYVKVTSGLNKLIRLVKVEAQDKAPFF